MSSSTPALSRITSLWLLMHIMSPRHLINERAGFGPHLFILFLHFLLLFKSYLLILNQQTPKCKVFQTGISAQKTSWKKTNLRVLLSKDHFIDNAYRRTDAHKHYNNVYFYSSCLTNNWLVERGSDSSPCDGCTHECLPPKTDSIDILDDEYEDSVKSYWKLSAVLYIYIYI